MKALLCAMFLCAFACAAPAREWQGNCPEFPDVGDKVMMCVADTLSSVEILFQERGTALAGNREKYASAVRSLAMAYFPTLRQENMSKYEAFEQFGTDQGALELKRRAGITLTVWTVADPSGYPVAYHVGARMHSYGATQFDAIEDATLGYCRADALGSVVEQALDGLMRGMGEQFRQGLSDFKVEAGAQ